jgi:hypothetical protein
MLSRQHKTIFVHIPKTAGQSVEQLFLDKLGLGWLEREPLLLTANTDPARGPARLDHLYAREYVECGHISDDEFRSLFRFTIVRDPYARVLSQYGHHYRDLEPDQFFDSLPFLINRNRRNVMPQVNFVFGAAGGLLVDEIIRFEDLPGAFAPIAQRIFGEAIELPHRNRARADRKVALDDRLRRRIYKCYEADFDAFRYPSGL